MSTHAHTHIYTVSNFILDILNFAIAHRGQKNHCIANRMPPGYCDIAQIITMYYVRNNNAQLFRFVHHVLFPIYYSIYGS